MYENTGDNALLVKQAGTTFAVLLNDVGGCHCNGNGGGTADAVAWDNVTGKPEKFPPTEHTHTVAQITDIEERLAEIVAGGELTVVGKSAYQSWLEQPGNAGKTEAEFVASLKGEDGETPNLAAYATKQYVDEEIAKIPSSGGGTADAVAWDNVTEKPATFPPSTHSHSEYATTAYVDSLVPFIGKFHWGA